jgi:hypothetical protein
VWSDRDFVTDGSGRMELAGLGPGEYLVRVGSREVRATLAAGDLRELVIE